ncbi:MAG: DRTGG domain-containing protein [Dehalococcoidia bacterium]|nr:DRTGG domain-containing protein [Dehalococcoidia bacterium]
MVALYVTSTESAGKTALCAGIGRKLLDRGAKVGFMEPIHVIETGNTDGCEDAAFIKDNLKLIESEELICPIRLSQHELWRNLTEDMADFSQNVKQAYRKISRGKDVVVVEGLSNLVVDKVSTLACYTVADALEAKVIVVLNYSPNFDVSKIVQVGTKFKHLMGVFINLVPQSKIETGGHQLAASFNKAGIKVLGIFPEVRSLLGVSVGELAQFLGGEILTCPEQSDGIVENVMVGAMTVDSGEMYFNRKEKKAVVVRGERSDMQLAALETPTKCLIVTDDVKPLSSVIARAQEKRVPIIMVKQDTSAAVACIEDAFIKASFRNRQKLETFSKVLDTCFDFKALYSELGLEA